MEVKFGDERKIQGFDCFFIEIEGLRKLQGFRKIENGVSDVKNINYFDYMINERDWSLVNKMRTI